MDPDEGNDEVFEVDFQEKVSENDLNHLILRGVKLNTSNELGQGSFGTVYKAEHNGTACAAKQRDISNVKSQSLLQRKKHHFLLECLQHSKLDHPNIVKMLGVFYPQAKQNDILPVLVMELMEYNLTQMLEKSPNIIMYVKLSILQDVSRGLCYLHAQNPPIVHQALYSDNILITKCLAAKIGDFKTGAGTVSDQAVLSERRSQIMQIYYFLPDSDNNIIKYDLALNVFSFGCIVCHVITQNFPSVQHQPEINTDDGPAHKLRSTPEGTVTLASVGGHTPLARRKSSTLDDWSVNKHQQYIDLICDNSLKQLVEACLQSKSKYRPQMSLVYERITSIMTDHCNDDDIKRIYSQVIEQGLDQSINFQLLLVGAENTGKTSLISSFLEEEFVEEQSITKGADVKVCKVHSKNWSRITDKEKSDMLLRRCSDLCKDEVLKSVADSSLSTSSEPSFPNLPRRMSYPDVLFTIAPLPKSFMTHCSSGAAEYSSKPHPQNMQEAPLNIEQDSTDSLIASLWDFAGQTIFHNSHSVFISDSGVTVITFNASLELTDKIIPRECSFQPPECYTIISSIHYWLQVVNSVCSVKENVLLVGTHIDKLHFDLKEARKIAREKILPVLDKELLEKPYAQHIACIGEGLTIALKKSCFFVSNKYRDEEIEYLKAAAVEVAALLREEKPIIFLKIEQALLQLNKQVISVSIMLDIVSRNGFSFNKNSPEFKGILKHFHNNRVILHFSQIESLKDLVILSPNWLTKLFSYVIAGQSYSTGGELDWAWKRLTKYGILHERLLQHMLNRFNSNYTSTGLIKVTKQQAVDILLYFHLLVCITSEVLFAEEDFFQLPERGDTFIVPSLVRADDYRTPPRTEKEKIIYFKFNSGFIPMSLLNQLIAECICRSVRRNDRLLWMRRGKMGSQLGADQKYYITRCDEKQSIQLTITVEGDDAKHVKERRDLINDIIKFLNDIMEVFMPATKERPLLLIPCPFCSVLHIFLDETCSGVRIYCPNADASDKSLPCGYYSNLLKGRPTDASTIADVNKKLKVFYANFFKLSHLNFKALCPQLVNAKIISNVDVSHVVQHKDPAEAACHILKKISNSLKGGTDVMFDDFVSILENNDFFCTRLAKEIRRDLSNAITLPVVKQPGHQDIEGPHEKQGLCGRPLPKDLYNHVVPRVADKWKDIGVELLHPTLIDDRVLEMIKGNHPHSNEECCKIMFDKWLESQKEASWNQLLEAIKATGLKYIASKLENELTEHYQHKSSQGVENKSRCKLM